MKRVMAEGTARSLQVMAMVITILITLIALLAPLLANERPLYCKYRGEHLFPAFSGKAVYSGEDVTGSWQLETAATDWKRLKTDRVIWALIPYSPKVSDYRNDFLNAGYKSPFSGQSFKTSSGKIMRMPALYRHWFGTGRLGEDVLSIIIHGTRNAVLIGLLSMLLAAIPGILLGLMAGFFGNGQLRLHVAWLIGAIPGMVLGWYYAWLLSWMFDGQWSPLIGRMLNVLVFILVMAFVMVLFRMAGVLMKSHRLVKVPVDAIIEKIMLLFYSIPRIILLIILASFFSYMGIAAMICIIAVVSWPGITRLLRGEVLRIRGTGFVDAVRALGFKPLRIMFRHILPIASGPALVALSYGVGSAVMLEAALSFLGIPVDEDIVSWGQLIAEGKDHLQAWWMMFFPAFAIFCLIGLSHFASERITKAKSAM